MAPMSPARRSLRSDARAPTPLSFTWSMTRSIRAWSYRRNIKLCCDSSRLVIHSPSMELRQLRYFAAVARHGSFTRAADELHLAQSAVSQQVRRLEAELGVELLARSTRRVEVTEAGEITLARASRVLAEVEALESELDELSGLVRGHLTVGGVLPAGGHNLPDLLLRFNQLHPNVELALREGTATDMAERLQRDELDVAIAMFEPGDVPSALVHRRLGVEELVVGMAPDDPLSKRKGVRLGD